MKKNSKKREERQAKTERLEYELIVFMGELLEKLNRQIDRRLVSTFVGLVMAIIMHRHRNQGLLLSELGGYLLGPERSCAGTKRISNLIHSEKWTGKMITRYLWRQGTERVREIQKEKELPMILWDESVLEKPESLKAERLCAVRSSKAQRLKRIKPGFFNPPGGRPIFVPGFNWLQVLVIGRKGPPTLAHFRWWTTRGDHKSTKRKKEIRVLRKIDALWGKQVLHIWDRGFAGNPWLTAAFVHSTQFVMRWPKNYKLLDPNGTSRKPGEISKGKRSWEHRILWDARRRCDRQVGIIAFPVFDTVHRQSLWLVVARRKNQSPWYLLTTQIITSPNDAWNIVHAYARRWQVEMSIRYSKSELTFESPRLVNWQLRKKLLLIAMLAYAFLLSILNPVFDKLRNWLLRTFCHRRRERRRIVPSPLYRLRLALSLFWLFYPPPLLSLL